MNDRYLFRAKRIDNGELIEGFLIFEKDRAFIAHRVCEVMNSYSKAGEEYGFGNFIEVDTSTICQCTGLKDKNGKLIWENDIVKPFADLKGIVRFGERNYSREFGFNIEWMSKSCYRRDILYWAEKCKVIGSVIDNPELLEQEG